VRDKRWHWLRGGRSKRHPITASPVVSFLAEGGGGDGYVQGSPAEDAGHLATVSNRMLLSPAAAAGATPCGAGGSLRLSSGQISGADNPGRRRSNRAIPVALPCGDFSSGDARALRDGGHGSGRRRDPDARTSVLPDSLLEGDARGALLSPARTAAGPSKQHLELTTSSVPAPSDAGAAALGRLSVETECCNVVSSSPASPTQLSGDMGSHCAAAGAGATCGTHTQTSATITTKSCDQH
jgi:hypothetical protein